MSRTIRQPRRNHKLPAGKRIFRGYWQGKKASDMFDKAADKADKTRSAFMAEAESRHFIYLKKRGGDRP